MKFTVLTLFPEMVAASLRASMMGRALEQGCFELELVQIRDYATNRYGKVDDRLAGGGTGLLMTCPALEATLQAHASPDARLLYLSPKGRRLDQALVEDLAQAPALTLLCGHYEGVDARFLEAHAFEEVSLGDFVLTGGEYGAAVLIDAVARLLPGVLPSSEAYEADSHFEGRLEAPQYASPSDWVGRPIPPVLLSGHHQHQAHFRRMAGLSETLWRRPDLFDALLLTPEEEGDFAEFLMEHLVLNDPPPSP